MGAFLNNIALKTENRDQVIDVLQKGHHAAYVSPSINRWTIIYDKKSEVDTDHSHDLCETLSKEFRTTAFFFKVEDSDFFLYSLYYNGKPYDGYVSNRERFFNSNSKNGKIGEFDKDRFISFFAGKPRSVIELTKDKKGFLSFFKGRDGNLEKEIKAILDKKYLFAEEQLVDLPRLLGISHIEHGYEYLSEEGEDLLGNDFKNFKHIKGSE